MMFCLVLSLLVAAVSANAVQQASEYNDLMNYYGESVDFLITHVTTYEVEWQKCSGDPHGQGAKYASSNNTLCWDFAGSQYHGKSLYLWEDPIHNFKMEGKLEARPNNETNRPDLQTSIIQIIIKRESGDDPFTVTMDASKIRVETSAKDEIYAWHSDFNEDLGEGVILSSSSHSLVELAADEYLYRFNLFGGKFFAVTLVDGDVNNLGGICGQLHSYTLYRSAHPALKDHALAIANHRLFRPFLVTKTHHVDAQKECWYYAQTGPIHGVFGNTNQYLTTFTGPP